MSSCTVGYSRSCFSKLTWLLLIFHLLWWWPATESFKIQ